MHWNGARSPSVRKAAGSRVESRRAAQAAGRGACPAAPAPAPRPGSAFWGLRQRTPLTLSPGFALPTELPVNLLGVQPAPHLGGPQAQHCLLRQLPHLERAFRVTCRAAHMGVPETRACHQLERTSEDERVLCARGWRERLPGARRPDGRTRRRQVWSRQTGGSGRGRCVAERVRQQSRGSKTEAASSAPRPLPAAEKGPEAGRSRKDRPMSLGPSTT